MRYELKETVTSAYEDFIKKFGVGTKTYKNLLIRNNKIVSIETNNMDIIKYVQNLGLK